VKLLRAAELVVDEADGTRNVYRLRAEGVEAEPDSPFLEGHGWGFGGSVDLAPTEPWNVPGRYGWVGGTGTAAYVIPSRRRLVIWMSQVELEGPDDARAMAAVLTWAAQRPDVGGYATTSARRPRT